MKLWRLTRKPFAALDGSGPEAHGGRWTSPGRPVVNFASEAALAVLVVLRYLPRDLKDIDQDYMLGFIESDLVPVQLPYDPDPIVKRRLGDEWLASNRSVFAKVTSAVLPEAEIIMMNPRHADAKNLPELSMRPFRFEDCLHLPKPNQRTKNI